MINIPKHITKARILENHLYCLEEWQSPSRLRTFEELKTKNIETVCDIGANTGAFIEVFWQHFPNAKIIALEPDSTNYEVLKYNFDLENISLYPYGIYYGIREGTSLNVIGNKNPGGQVFSAIKTEHLGPYQGHMEENKETIFHMKELEEVLISVPSLIKMDVEGSEYNIIEYSKILKLSNHLIIEFHNHDENYIRQFISTQLSDFNLDILTNEHYGTSHHWYSFLNKRN